ncbi:MAG: glutamate--cysteine ligase [Corynebacterium sp.]|nr:glutamate--cysteine ligase [Corynebacterium sp.]
MPFVEEKFARSERPTLGVEWEVALVDPKTRDLVPRAQDILGIVAERAPEVHLEGEFLQNTVEIVTGVCDTVPEAIAELHAGVTQVSHAAETLGLRVWSSGGHPFSDFRENPVAEKGTYNEIINRTQYWGQQMLLWGTHVHVGISHEDRVWPIINALLTKYPHLLALSASSPGWESIDTGYASNRTMLYQQLPTAGLPYQFATWQDWQDYMRDQTISGVINHTGSMHFDIRPAAKWGTVEVRVCDAVSNLREMSAIVALTHCLVVHFDRMIDEGKELPTLQPWHVAENKWRGARYGLDAEVIVSRDTKERWVKDELADLVEQLEPLALELGCDQELRLVLEIIDRGAGYQRQRSKYQQTSSWEAVVDMTCDELQQLRPLHCE